MKNGTNYLLIVILIAAALFVLSYLAITKKTDVVKDSNNKDYDVVMALDFAENYPKSPDKVLEAYNQIERFLSGNISSGFTDEDFTALIDKQRQLMDIELLSINPLESHLAGYREKIEYLDEIGMRIVQINVETPIFSEDAKRCSIAVSQYWNKNSYIRLIYNMRKEAETGKWKIIGWSVNSEQPLPDETDNT